MTAVDFAVFVERLAQVSGEVILPFFRIAISSEDKSKLDEYLASVREVEKRIEGTRKNLDKSADAAKTASAPPSALAGWGLISRPCAASAASCPASSDRRSTWRCAHARVNGERLRNCGSASRLR